MQVITSTTFPKLHLDDLEDQIVNLSTRINASEYEFLVLLREFDLRQGWKAWGCLDCAAWLTTAAAWCQAPPERKSEQPGP